MNRSNLFCRPLTFLRQYVAGSGSASSDASDYRLRQYLNPSEAVSAEHAPLFDQPKLVSRGPGVRRYLLPFLGLLIVALGWASTYVVDYNYTAFLIERQLEGRPVESCLDLPAKYWTRMPTCLKLYFPEEYAAGAFKD